MNWIHTKSTILWTKLYIPVKNSIIFVFPQDTLPNTPASGNANRKQTPDDSADIIDSIAQSFWSIGKYHDIFAYHFISKLRSYVEFLFLTSHISRQYYHHKYFLPDKLILIIVCSIFFSWNHDLGYETSLHFVAVRQCGCKLNEWNCWSTLNRIYRCVAIQRFNLT